MEILSGQTIKGYELKERLGTGGFGAVYRAYQSTVGREVAIKIILPGFANHPEFIRRFETEAQLIARLEHAYITPLYDYWRDPEGAYLVMRWLRGGNLQQALQSGAFDIPTTLLILEQMTAALATAHRSQIIHRDLKPANILLDEDGNAYLADFGIAKNISGLEKAVTQADVIMGSPDYLAPEQARSEGVTPQTDIYSLGVILYEVLTGEHPFPNLSAVERLYKHLNDPLPMIENLPAQIVDQVNQVIQKATAKDPTQRYSDALEFMTAFRAAVAISLQKTPENVVEILTRREQEILQLIVGGLSNKEIAQELFLTVGTVKWYTVQIYSKLQVRSRVQAIVRARELNLIVSIDSDDRSLTAEGSPTPSTQLLVENPYKGLLAFQSSDHMDFFGREKIIQKLVKRLQTTDESYRFLAILGPSGSGKSSLLKAGLIPALWRGDLPGSEKWFVVEMVPGTHPLDELEIALVRISANQASNLHEQLLRDERGLVRAANLILPRDDSELVVVIDQFEEIFTLLEDETTRLHFIRLLVNAVTDPRSRVRVIITLRTDFYDRPLHYPQLGDLVRSRMETLLPLSAEELEHAISKPAERVGVQFEDGLVASIISEINYQPGALPLLQYALTELFEQREGRTLTHKAYQAIGRAVGALANRAEQLYAGLPSDQQELTRQMFLQLVTVSQSPQVTRRRVRRTDLLSLAAETDVMDELIDTFAAYRLLTLDHDAGTRSPTVEVAHEAILREWQRLSNWINEYQEDIKMREQLDHIAQQWDEKGKEVSYLVSGQRLTQFEAWADEKRQALTALERAYLEASLAERTQQAETETKRQQREQKLELRSLTFLRGLVVVMALALFGAIGLTGVATNQSNQAVAARFQAEDQARIATARELVGYANANLNTDAELSTLLAMQAVNTTYKADGSVLPEANTVLHQAIQGLHTSLSIASGIIGVGQTANFTYTPDGSRIIFPLKWGDSVSDMATGIADAQTGKLLYSIPGDKLGAFSDGNDFVATFGGTDAALTLVGWDLRQSNNPKKVSEISSQLIGSPNWADFSSDLHWALTVEENGTFHAWDLLAHQEIVTPAVQKIPKGNGEPIFSPDGKWVGNRNSDGTLSLLNATTWEEVRRLSASGTNIRSFTFSLNSQFIVTGNVNQTVSVFEVASGVEKSTIKTEIAPKFIAISADQTRLATANVAGEISIWDVQSQQQILTLAASQTAAITLSPDGSHLASLQNDGHVQIWNLLPGRELLTMVNETVPDRGPVSLAYSPDGKRLVTASNSETAVVWNSISGQKEFALTGHTGRILSTAWSQDGTYIATAGDDKDIILWDANTGKEALKLSGHTDSIYGLAFSPNGKRIASSSYDKTVRIWDVTTGKQMLKLDQPEQSKGVAWSPDNKFIAAGTDIADGISHIQIWNAESGTKQLDIPVGNTRVGMVTFSPDGKHILAGTLELQAASVWDVTNGQKILTVANDIDIVAAVAYSLDGKQFATASLDGTVKLWDANNGKELLTIFGAPDGVGRVVFSPDGKYLATQNVDGTTRIYVLDIDDLLALAKSRLTRWWTVDECKKYLHTDTCPAQDA